MHLLTALFQATVSSKPPLAATLSLTQGECLSYWAKLKDTENLRQAAATVVELNRRSRRQGRDPWDIKQWTQVLEHNLIGYGML